jgi:uncharacterized protein (UPF0332 family)
MSPVAADLWQRAKDAFRLATNDLSLSADGAAAWAYYAAFYAVSAHFALAGRTFRKHSAVQGVVHRDLVASGIWSKDLGEGYDELLALRNTGHYGGPKHVPPDEARRAIRIAADILRAVADLHPDVCTGLLDE